MSTPKSRHTLPNFVVKLWCDSFENNSFENNPFGKSIIELLRKEEEEFNGRLECLFSDISAILQEGAPQALNDIDLFKKEVRSKNILSNERLSKEARFVLNLCFNAYRSHQDIAALEILYTKATAFQRVPAPLPDDSASSHLGPPQRASSFDSSQESDLQTLDNAYQVYFGQKSFTPEGHIFQKDPLGLGIYHFYMAEKLKGIHPTVPKENWATLKFHDGYASGNTAFKAYERAGNYFSHCRSIEGAKFFMAKCYEGRGYLLRKWRVGDPWEVGENHKMTAIQRVKKELLKATEIRDAESSQIFYQLIRVADSRNTKEVVRLVGKWQRSTKRYEDVLKWVEGDKDTQEPRFKEYEQDLSTAVTHYNKVSESIMSLRDEERDKLVALLEGVDELRRARPSGSSRGQVPCEEGNGEQAF
jgi:hypothetical protein